MGGTGMYRTIPQLVNFSNFLLVIMDGQSYLSLSNFLYESLPSGEVMDKIDKWLTIDDPPAKSLET